MGFPPPPPPPPGHSMGMGLNPPHSPNYSFERSGRVLPTELGQAALIPSNTPFTPGLRESLALPFPQGSWHPKSCRKITLQIFKKPVLKAWGSPALPKEGALSKPEGPHASFLKPCPHACPTRPTQLSQEGEAGRLTAKASRRNCTFKIQKSNGNQTPSSTLFGLKDHPAI